MLIEDDGPEIAAAADDGADAQERYVLVVNPGSTSTKVALFREETALFNVDVEHPKSELARFDTVMDQLGFRRAQVERELRLSGHGETKLAAVVGRGGLLAPMRGGTYAVSAWMLEELRTARHGEHPCNLGAPLAREFAARHGARAFVVDPVVTDELADEARITGLPEIERRSVFHALSQKSAARRAAAELGVDYGEANFIVAHMGGGISVGAHLRGRVVEVNDALEGDGPFSPERSGGLPALQLLRLLHEGRMSFEQLRAKILKEGGLWAHLGTNDLREVAADMERGDAHAKLLFEALALAVSREICARSAMLCGKVDAVVLTGGMARGESFVARIRERVEFLGPVVVLPEVKEMEALCDGALRVLRGEETAREYVG